MNQPNTNEDVPQDLSLDEYHRALIEEGIRQGDAGEVLDHETVMSIVAGRRPPKRTVAPRSPQGIRIPVTQDRTRRRMRLSLRKAA